MSKDSGKEGCGPITGDLESFASEFGFPYTAANLLCPYCQADANTFNQQAAVAVGLAVPARNRGFAPAMCGP